MKRHLSLFGMSAALMLGVAGCAMASSPDQYFVVQIYGDYEGMEADAAKGYYDKSKATNIGYCYVAKEQKDPSGVTYGKFNIGGIRARTYSGSSGTQAYDYRSSLRTVENWYQHYVFNKFAGFYATGNAIDLSKITADCDLFANFDLVNYQYSTSVRDPYNDLYMEAAEFAAYGTKIADIPSVKEALLNFPASHDYKADPDDPSTWRDPYYCTYTNDDWYLYAYGENDKLIEQGEFDRNGKPITMRIDASSPEKTLEAINNLTVMGRMVFTPGFIEDYKNYTVSISYQTRTLIDFDTETGEAYFEYHAFEPPKNTSGKDLPTSLSVRYGSSIFKEDPEPAKGFGLFDIPNYRLTLDGKDGEIDRYDISDPLAPAQIKQIWYDDEGQRHEIGAMVKRKEIWYDCSITLVYEDSFQYEVRFHGDPNDSSIVTETQLVNRGDGANPLTKLKDGAPAPAGKAFVTGQWTETEGSLNTADLSIIDHDMDLYPVYVPDQIESPTSHFIFEFDNYYCGYTLISVPDNQATVAVADFTAPFPEEFPFRAVRSFGNHADKIVHLALPMNVLFIDHGAFSSLTNVEDIDLSAAQIDNLPSYSFKNLMHLGYIHLPATLNNVGSRQFDHCTELLKAPAPGGKRVEIDLTEAEVAARIESGAFYSDWHSGAHVTYKAAA